MATREPLPAEGLSELSEELAPYSHFLSDVWLGRLMTSLEQEQCKKAQRVCREGLEFWMEVGKVRCRSVRFGADEWFDFRKGLFD